MPPAEHEPYTPPRKRARTRQELAVCPQRACYERASALLHLAALDHDENAARKLLRACPENVDHENDPSGARERALHVACNVGAAGVVRVLLGSGADAEAPQGNGATPLCIAAEYGHDEIIQQLLSAGAQVDGFSHMRDGADTWPLRFAANWGWWSSAKLLLDARADPNITATSETVTGLPGGTCTVSALLMACVAHERGHVDVAKLLIQRGADPWLGSVNGGHCLHVTASRGHLGLVDVLLCEPRHKLDVNRRIHVPVANPNAALKAACIDGYHTNPDHVGATALYLASEKGHAAVVKRLLAQGANPNTPNWRGDAPITVATMRSNTDVVRVLIRAKADLEAAPSDMPTPIEGLSRAGDTHWIGKTALCTAAMRDADLTIARLLIDAGAELEATDCCGDSPLQTAVYFGQFQMAQQLLAAGANLTQRNTKGETALHIACHRGNVRVLRLLLSHGADPSLRTADSEMVERLQMTPLHTAFVAAAPGLLGVVHELVAGGAVWLSPLPADAYSAEASLDPGLYYHNQYEVIFSHHLFPSNQYNIHLNLQYHMI